jgi:hypothetical protein
MAYLFSVHWTAIYVALVCLSEDRVEGLRHLLDVENRKTYHDCHDCFYSDVQVICFQWIR